MTKFKGGFGVNTEEAISADPGDVAVGYAGPLPPAGIYRGTLKRMELTKTGPDSKVPGTPMLKMLVEISEPENSEKAKYNKYGIWTNQMVTEQGAPYVNQLLSSLVAGDEKKLQAVKQWFWNGQLNTEKADGGHIYAIGKFKINSPDAAIPVIVNTKKGRTTEKYPDPRLEIRRWLVPSDAEKSKSDDFDEVGGVDEDLGEDFDNDDLGDEFE